jgi:outer membrane protein OmpA-like peptidoglycan-associated protein
MHRVRAAVTIVALVAVASSARAQETVQKSFPVQLFEPALGVGMDTFFGVEGAGVAEHLAFGVGLLFNYQHKPLVLYRQDKIGTTGGGFQLSEAKETVLVENQMTSDIVGALGLHYKWLHAQVGLDLPINLVVRGTEVNDQGTAGATFSASGIGDLRLQLKAMIIRDLAGFSLAFSPILTFPTGKDDGFGGDPNVSFRPRFAASFTWRNLFTAADIGYLFRQSSTLFSSEVGHQLLYGVGAGYRVHPRVALLAELNGRSGFGTKSGCSKDPKTGQTVCADTSSNDLDAHPLEMDLGGRVNVAHGIDVTAGVGFGLIKAIGSPQFRVLAGVRWAPDFKDADGDGVPDYRDKCPTQPEDRDGFQDQDGCPDPDNDADGIPDVRDRCPNEAEDKDGVRDEDGCPDPDNDGDGIPDIKDECPREPETYNGFKDEDGCPDEPDRDGDGVPDKVDRCPDEPEDKDGFEDADGCPDPDNDNDGVPDKLDDCPNDPEDMDGFKDDDGCPDPDNDKDGICDPWVEKQGLSKKYAHVCTGSDKCPNQAETINGIKDEDGCPDQGASHVKIEEGKIVITKKIFFDTNKATIKKVSNSILTEVALTLKVHQEIKGVRIEGHTDSQGKADRNKKLSQERAEAVRDWLVKKGIPGGRLFAAGFGQEKPIGDNRTAKGREQNRRVEFIILEQAPGEGAGKPAPKKEEPPVSDAEAPQAKPANPAKPANQ